MAVTVSQMQSMHQKLKNGLEKNSNRFNEKQRKEMRKSLHILQDLIGKLQGTKDQKKAHDKHEITLLIDSAIPWGPEHIGETEFHYE